MKTLKNYKKLHFIGIGGVSMSVLALFLKDIGYKVSGSDKCNYQVVNTLIQNGIYAYVGNNPKNVEGADLVVFTPAISPTDDELLYAKAHNIDVIERKFLLALISAEFKTTIAISGTHGKTTTTGMVANVFKAADMAIMAHIGGYSNNFNGGYYFSGKDYFITEACEYQRSFLTLKPNLNVILNIDSDHPDCYKDFDEIKVAFSTFATLGENCVVLNNQKDIVDTNTPIITFGPGGEYWANKIVNNNEYYSFQVMHRANVLFNVSLNVLGKHNILNSLACVAVCKFYKIENNIIKTGLESYQGIKRRYEIIGTKNNAQVVTDYAHHPSEIATVLETAKNLAKGKIIVVFEPHTFSRTKRLFNEFVNCFKFADEVVILPTYPAREKECDGVNSFCLFAELNKNQQSYYFNSYAECIEHLSLHLTQTDYVLVLGAGNVDKLAEELVGVKH